MPSIFSRSRTTSSPFKQNQQDVGSTSNFGGTDEFGRVSSRQSHRKVEKSKTMSSAYLPEPPHQLPDGSFLPLDLSSMGTHQNNHETTPGYGYLAYEKNVILSIEQVSRLVEVCCEQLGTRGGITTPFIFANMAMDLSTSALHRLIKCFLQTCDPHASANDDAKWRTEAKFAGMHELGMCLRWGLARLVRIEKGLETRGLVSFSEYLAWKDEEARLHHPPTHFVAFLPSYAPLRNVILTTLSLLTRLVANSNSSGHTPPSLSPLFGPLFFGLGNTNALNFHHSYIWYLRSANALEHILLSFIRWQDTPRPASAADGPGAKAALAVPTRLKEWIKDYPATLPFLRESVSDNREWDKPQPRRGARTVRILTIRRNVRIYSADLVKSASSWAYSRPSAGATSPQAGVLANSREWENICPAPSNHARSKMPPKYSDTYRKKMQIPPNMHPDSGAAAAPNLSLQTSTSSSYLSSSTTDSPSDYFSSSSLTLNSVSSKEDLSRFRSLTDMKWGEFESMGFGGLGAEDGATKGKLEFDLNESARSSRAAKRQTLSWNDFSLDGFSRTDDPLTATLQFSKPVASSIGSFPSQNSELARKLKKTQKALPAFGWDTEPVVGGEEVVEEGFIDVFCDLVSGGWGWPGDMGLPKEEAELDRDCNWALIEFKSLPSSRQPVAEGSDPRTATTHLLFEEYVPLEYRQQLCGVTPNANASVRKRLPSLFSSPAAQRNKPKKGGKEWKQAATLNGKPYTIGAVPSSPTYREAEFEGLLRGNAGTKVITLNPRSPSKREQRERLQLHNDAAPPVPAIPSVPAAVAVPSHLEQPRSETPPGRMPYVGLPSSPSPVPMSPATMKKSRFKSIIPAVATTPTKTPAEYSTVDFETRLASYSDDDDTSLREAGQAIEPEDVKQKRRQSRSLRDDDTWVDILVGSQRRRLDDQSVEMAPGANSSVFGAAKERRRRGGVVAGEDPEAASLEVEKALAEAKERSLSPDSSVSGPGRYSQDDDVSAVETVPRVGGGRSQPVESFLSDYSEPEAVDEEDVVISPPARPRLTYFDLHPDRRPMSVNPVDDDFRARLAYDSDEEDEQPLAQALPGTSPPNSRPLPIVPPAPGTTPPIEAPPPVAAPRAPLPVPRVVTPPEASRPLPAVNGNGQGPAPTKTASLIEMYREKERGSSPSPASSPIVAPAPSKLPIRIGSSLKENGEGVPAQGAAPTPAKVSPPQPERLPLPEPPKILADESGRASPARYVHGAPLHNVVEEEEED